VYGVLVSGSRKRAQCACNSASIARFSVVKPDLIINVVAAGSESTESP
jgi:hypothetical protein